MGYLYALQGCNDPLEFSKTETISLISHLKLKLASGEAKHSFNKANECARSYTREPTKLIS